MMQVQLSKLLSESQRFDELTVGFDVLFHQIVEKPSPFSDHFEKSHSGMVVLGILLQVPVEQVDPGCQDSYLDLGGACVSFMLAVFFGNLLSIDHVSSCVDRYSPLTGHALEERRIKSG